MEGSDFTDEDIRRYANVGIMGQEVARELFGDQSPVGKFVEVRNLPVQIVGVLSERGTSPGGGSLDNRIIMPYTTVMKKLQNESRYVVGMRLRFTDLENVDGRVEELKTLLRYVHRIPDRQPDDFRIFTSKDIVSSSWPSRGRSSSSSESWASFPSLSPASSWRTCFCFP